jgi:DNA-binding transcriptional MocR family regulator
VKARLRTRLAAAQKAVLRSFPVGTRCERPLGGWVLWVDLPAGVSGRELAEAARGEGVLVSPGGDFAPDRADTASLRISVTRTSGAELEKALESVGALARAAARRAQRRVPRAEERREEALIQI